MTNIEKKQQRVLLWLSLLLVVIAMFLLGRLVAEGQVVTNDIFAATYFIGFVFGVMTGLLVLALWLARPPTPPRMLHHEDQGDD